MRTVQCVSIGVLLTACHPKTAQPKVSSAPEVSLAQLEDGLWLHTSTRVLEKYGRVLSHGLVVQQPDGALLVDSAWGADLTDQLLHQIEEQLGAQVRAAVVTDFHDDRAGGVPTLLAEGVPVYTTSGISAKLGLDLEIIESPFAAELAGADVEVFFPGGGHSPENLVVWLADHRVLFGGCLVRPGESQNLGNRADAVLSEWGPSARATKERYGGAILVVPSHGNPGGTDLLDHTAALVDKALSP